MSRTWGRISLASSVAAQLKPCIFILCTPARPRGSRAEWARPLRRRNIGEIQNYIFILPPLRLFLNHRAYLESIVLGLHRLSFLHQPCVLIFDANEARSLRFSPPDAAKEEM